MCGNVCACVCCLGISVIAISLSQRLPACVPFGDSLIFYFVCVVFTRIFVKSQNKHKNPLQIRAARHLNQILIVAISCFAFEIKTTPPDWLNDWLCEDDWWFWLYKTQLWQLHIILSCFFFYEIVFAKWKRAEALGFHWDQKSNKYRLPSAITAWTVAADHEYI